MQTSHRKNTTKLTASQNVLFFSFLPIFHINMQKWSCIINCVSLSLSISLDAQTGFAPVAWATELPNLGTFSSPRMADLNGDGILDVIMGAGREEFTRCDTAVVALDGKDGALLWKVTARDQIFGSATLLDITGDSIKDVFIGGRSAELIAINGASGEVLWRFLSDDNVATVRKKGWYNFYNPQAVPDVSGDNIPDLLVSNGGDVLAEPYDTNRAAGHLALIDGSNGQVIKRAVMPDSNEIYMSIVVADLDHDDQLDIIFGTGGETTPGYLYRGTFDQVLDEDLSSAKVLAAGGAKGFIAPPVLADLTDDGIYDIICNSVDGRMMAFNGENNEVIWGGQIPRTEVYSSLAVGDITRDSVPDFFGNYAIGIWPDLEGTRPLLVDGKRGKLLYIDSIGFYQMSSGVVADFNTDGHIDALISANFFKPNALGEKTIHNSLLVYDFQNQGKYAISSPEVGSNVASTPWIGDMDGDGFFDIVYCLMTTPDKVYTYDGFKVIRLKTKFKYTANHWGAYMGNNYDGLYRPNR